MNYGDILITLNMFTIEERRTKSDLIQSFEFMKLDDVKGLKFSTDNATIEVMFLIYVNHNLIGKV